MEQSQDNYSESSKQKLTLGIDRNVLEKAKAAGINISENTEQWLTVITYHPNDRNRREDVTRAWEALFEKVRSLMSKYCGIQFQIRVGEMGLRKIFLDSDYGLLIWDDHEQNMIRENPSVDSVLHFLYEPTKILENLIATLTEIAEINKEKITELKFALRIVEALSDDEGEHQK